eukprot:s244_g36.t1
MSRRVWKLQDFVAHTGRVQCARLGEKSGQVLATGGDDKRVNIWKVGKPNAMMSLTGHTSSVECLVFDKQEEVLIVGCAGGSMQCWNLEYRKMAGSLAGHRTACTCVEFHPYGEFFASGSNDTNLKIWDLRRKSCIQTYPGHSAPVSAIRFSPHGRWVATGGLDNQVKIWDLTAGKQMKDLDLHKGAVTSLSFHPKEYLLASGSADRTVILWSLESFLSVGVSSIGATPVQAVKFYPEEQAVLSASQDLLRLHPCSAVSNVSDAMEVDWKGLQDIRLCYPEEKLLAVSADGSQLGLWVADLRKDSRVQAARRPATGGSGRASPTQAPPRPELHPEPEEERVPPAPPAPPAPSPAEVAAEAKAAAFAAVERLERLERLGRGPSGEALGDVAAEPPKRPVERRPQSPGAAMAQVVPPAPSTSSAQYNGGVRNTDSVRSPQAASAPPVTRLDMETVSAQHPQMLGVLKRRLDQSKRLAELWVQGNISGIDKVLTLPQDQDVLCDFCRSLMQKDLGSVLNLDACAAFLPLLKELFMTCKYEDFIATALEFTSLLLDRFGGLINETRESCAKIPERQMDLAREGRYRKCNACYEDFKEIHRLLGSGHSGITKRSAKLNSSLQAFLLRGERVHGTFASAFGACRCQCTMACGCAAGAPCRTMPTRLSAPAAHGSLSMACHPQTVALAPFPASACKVVSQAVEAAQRVCSQPLAMSSCQVQMPVRQSSGASVSKVQLPMRQSSSPVSVSKAGYQTPGSARVSAMASFAPESLAQAKQQELDQLREALQASRANEVRLQAELQAAKEQIQHLAAALEQEKCARAEAALASPTKKAEASPRSPRTPKSPQRVARAPSSPRRAESRKKEPADEHRGSRSGGDAAPSARPLGERPRVTRRGSSPAALRRPAKDEVDTKLTEYLASSPHCQLEFCRLNQGWYQFRHVDTAMETKCLEMSIVNGKLMVKFEPTNHDRG